MRLSSIAGHVTEVFSIFRINPAIPADAILRRFFVERKYLGAKDRRSIAEYYYAIIKNHRRLEARVVDAFPDEQVADGNPDVPIFEAQMVATLLLMRGIDSVEVQATFADIDLPFPLTNMERLGDDELERERLEKLSLIERLAILYSFPTWFAVHIGAEYGMDAVEPILASLNQEAPLSLRANTLLTTREILQEELRQEGFEGSFSMIAPDALTIGRRISALSLESFRRGLFEVQDEASQLVVPFAQIRKTAIKALDACAGAGGKTLHLSALMKNHGEIYATDVEARKLEELKVRSRRSSAQNIRIVVPVQKEKMLGEDKTEWFDLVLLDVPCTGTGTLRRNPGIKWVLTEQMLSELLQKQQIILEENARFVKPGGTMLYATCSLLKEEGEDQLKWFVEAHPEFILEETRRTRTDIEGCDGFFVARLKKTASAST
jgi:16S rRNA (cytosine967-C5)-methyltransferase